LKNEVLRNLFSEKYPSAKEPVGLLDIRNVSSRHVECIIMMTNSGSRGR